MKRNKLFTAIAAVALLGSTGAALVQPNTPVAQAAKKSKKKTAKYATVRIRRGAPAYKITIKGNKVTKVSRLTRKHKKQSFGGGKSYVFWSFKHKKTTYYYIGGSTAVRAKDAKRVGKKRIPSLNSIVTKAVNERKAKIQDWQNKLDTARAKSYPAKVTKEAIFFNVKEDGSATRDANTLPVGTVLNVKYRQDDSLKTTDGKMIPVYIAMTTDNKEIILPVEDVTLDDPSMKVPTADEYTATLKSILDAANKDLGNN